MTVALCLGKRWKIKIAMSEKCIGEAIFHRLPAMERKLPVIRQSLWQIVQGWRLELVRFQTATEPLLVVEQIVRQLKNLALSPDSILPTRHCQAREREKKRERKHVSIQWKIIKNINKPENCSNEEERRKKNNFHRIINAYLPWTLKQLIFKIAIPVGGKFLVHSMQKEAAILALLTMCTAVQSYFDSSWCASFLHARQLKSSSWHLKSLAMRF